VSDLTPCNHCTLRWMRERLAPGEALTTRPKPTGMFADGVDVFIHPFGIEPDRSHWCAWFAELPEACAC
jgi:hypothetical protein